MRNLLGRTCMAFGAAALAAGAMAASSGVASAATHAGNVAKPGVVRISTPMKIVRFDPAVARAHGYVIRTDSQGREYSVKAGSKSGPTPDNTVYGNCGSSYMWEWGIGNHEVTVSTGFTVNNPALAYYWKYWMLDQGGLSSHTHSGGLALRFTWGVTENWGGLTPGPASAWVDTSSDAILDDGGVCTSGGPSDSTTIF